MTKLVDLKPNQIVLTNDGSLRVGFFDKICETQVQRNERGEIISSVKEPKLYIHIEVVSDNKTIFEGIAKERKILVGDEFRYIHEKDLFKNAYAKYLEAKNSTTIDPYAEIEELKRKLAASESLAITEASNTEAEIAKKGRKKAVELVE